MKKFARPKSPSRKRWCIGLSIAVIIVIIIVIIVPLAVLLPKRGHKGQKSTVILPLYIYPSIASSWDPLYEALEAHPELHFLVVINPSSGPGNNSLPDGNYSAQIIKLNNYTNVETVGYVRTRYATQNISLVAEEVATYAGWATQNSSLAMHGIFFDEAPHEYSVDAVSYMQTVNQVVKNSTGLQGAKTVIHNPGVIPDSRFDASTTDITVIFEESYPVYNTKASALTDLSKKNRTEYAYMVNSVPTQSLSSLRSYVDMLSEHAAYLFVTNASQDFYESFGAMWSNFTAAVPT